MHEFEDDTQDLVSELEKDLNITEKDWEKIINIVSVLDDGDAENYVEMSFIYYGEPKAQSRARHSRLNDFFYDPSKSLKAWLLEQVMGQMPKNFKPIDTEIEMSLEFYRATPKSFSRHNKILAELKYICPNIKPDADNYTKLVQDALNSTLYTDDAIITVLSAKKYYSCKPRVKIFIRFKTSNYARVISNK